MRELEQPAERDCDDHSVTDEVSPLPNGAWRVVAEAGPIVRLAVPLVGAQIAMVAMSATDAAFLGHLGPTVLAGAGLAASIHATVQIVGAGALTVLAPVIAECRARGEGARVASVTRHGLALAVVLGAIGAAIVWNGGLLLRPLDHATDVARVAVPFLLSLIHI